MTATETRALELLGSGLTQELVASALGVTQARISQLLSDETFAKQVQEKRFQNLQKHNLRDATYDEVEDTLLEKFKEMSPLLVRPMEILTALRIINGQKRRGQSAPDSVHAQQTVVALTIPVQVVNRFTQDSNNQVIEAGTQTLLTLPSGKMQELSRERKSNGSGDEKRVTFRGRITADTINNL